MQEIGPRFTLKLRWLKKGIPAVQNFGEAPKPLEFDAEPPAEPAEEAQTDTPVAKTQPPKQDEYLWIWKVWFEICRFILRSFVSYYSARVGDFEEDILPLTGFSCDHTVYTHRKYL